MRRISFALMSTLAAVVLLFGYRTSTPHPTSVATTTVAAGSAGTPAGSGATPSAPATTGTSPSAPTSTPSTNTPSSSTSTVTGQVAQTRWGPVQVQLTVTGGKITNVEVLQQPSGNGRDVEINNEALPVLEQETISAQSAHIDTVSGATVTSDGYLTSLQSALDSAGL